jgi:hypothetical protein
MDREVPLLQPTGPGSGPTVYYRGLHLYSSRRPEAAPDRLVAETPLLPETLILIPSLGLGYGVDRLLERLPRHCHVLCVEHDPALWNLARQARRDLAGRDHVTLLLAENLAPLKGFLDALPVGLCRRVVTLPLCGGARLFPEFYRTVETFLADGIQTYWQNRMTLIHMGRLFIKNLYANLALLPRARDLGGLATDRPVVVVGAGPSLSFTLPLLRRLRKRTILLAVDTALPVLLDSGLTPDYVLALEPQFININDFLGLPDASVAVLADLASSPQVVRFCLERRRCEVFFFSSVFHPLSLWRRLEEERLRPSAIPPLGSVGVAAVYASLLITRGAVLCSGLDFSYPLRRTHAAGSPSLNSELATARRSRPVGHLEFAALTERPRVTLRDKNGSRVESDLVLSSYAKHLQALIAGQKRVYDISPLGLDLGAPFLSRDHDIMGILDGSAAGGTPAPPASRPAAWNIENVKRFYESERRLLEESDAVWRLLTAPAAPESGVIEGERRVIVARTEHAYVHLPGKAAWPAYTRASAARALIEGRILSERIRRLTLTL